MKQKRTKSILCTLLLPTLLLCTCTTGEEPILPESKYPMTFTTEVDGLMASRATTDNTWDGGEEVAVQIGKEVKRYKAAENGNLSGSGSEVFYWKTADDEYSVMAWYPYFAEKPTTFTVETNQHGDGYQKSDCLLSDQIMATFKGSNNLTFKHLPAKVTINLKNGDGITAEEVTNATVDIVNQATTSGTINENGTVVQVSPGGNEILTNTLFATTSDVQKSVQALLVPQQMEKTQFIKVTTDSNGNKSEYFYTPENEIDGDLIAGHQYTYTITITKKGLQVEAVSASWKDDKQDEDATVATFRVHLENFAIPGNTNNYEVKDAEGTLTPDNDIYTVKNGEINISLSADENYYLKTFLTNVTAGICKIKSSYEANTRTYTNTLYDIHSDLWLNIKAEAEDKTSLSTTPQVGDYYFADDTWSSSLTKSCIIGVIFKVGAGEGDDASKYESTGIGANIRGYVVALHDAHDEIGGWGIRSVDAGLDKSVNKYDGYTNTQIVRKLDKYGSTDISKPMANDQYWAFKVASQYDVAVPENTSGWYLPSIQQLIDIDNCSDLATKLTAADGNDFKRTENNGRYWSATEASNLDAWFYQFKSKESASNAKSNNLQSNESKIIDYLGIYSGSYIRSILTF